MAHPIARTAIFVRIVPGTRYIIDTSDLASTTKLSEDDVLTIIPAVADIRGVELTRLEFVAIPSLNIVVIENLKL